MALDHAAGLWWSFAISKARERDYMAKNGISGKEAKEIAASGLSLEEYYGFEGGDMSIKKVLFLLHFYCQIVQWKGMCKA